MPLNAQDLNHIRISTIKLIKRGAVGTPISMRETAATHGTVRNGWQLPSGCMTIMLPRGVTQSPMGTCCRNLYSVVVSLSQ